MHEFIHFFQWNTGKSIYQFQTSVLSDKEIEEISDILNFDSRIKKENVNEMDSFTRQLLQ